MKVVLDHLKKVYPNLQGKKYPDVTAVEDFTLEIPDGKLVSLLGPSGCGKSTVLNMICGLTEATEGKIYFGDQDVTDLTPEKRGVGMVFQNYALYPHLTVLRNITFPLENLKGDKKMTRKEMDDKALEVAKMVQIEELLKRKPKEMSGGQQQRVAIARALVKMPKILLLDEPLSNLDARLRLQTREEIRRIQKETGITTIFVTHDQEEAMSISDFIIVMAEKRINQVGHPQEVYDDPHNLFVAKFLGTPQINTFHGEIKKGYLYLGKDRILETKGIKDQEVYVGIRPEGFILDDKGSLHCKLVSVGTTGRDTSIVSTNENSDDVNVRSIISADNKVDTTKETVSFSIKPHKIFIFDKETQKRIYLKEENNG